MSENLTPRQQILLWDLISRGGSALQKELKPEVKPTDREPLVRAKMISVSKVERALRLTIEDAGWNRLSSEAPTLLKAGDGSKYDRPILQFVLASVQTYAALTAVSYADILSGGPSAKHGRENSVPPDAVDKEPPMSIETAIRSAFFELAGRPARDGVRLRALRDRLRAIDRVELDATLLKMRADRTAKLLNLNNPRDIEAEGDAALKIGDQTFHLIWID